PRSRLSPTTPTTTASEFPCVLHKPTCCPIGSWLGKMSLARRWLIITRGSEGGSLFTRQTGRSFSSKRRPRTKGSPTARKYPGETTRHPDQGAECSLGALYASMAIPGLLDPRGRWLTPPTAITSGRPPTRSHRRLRNCFPTPF